MSALRLEERDQALLAGEAGEAARLAMRVIVRMAELQGARDLVDIAMAHVDGCLYHGDASLEFAERLADLGGRVVVPTTLNAGSLEFLRWPATAAPRAWAAKAQRVAAAYLRMGARPTWTCAPYQADARPAPGQHVAWAESNAIVFANSVLGARTERYGDFIDICAALTGRVPRVGLHLDENRRGEVVFRLENLPARLLEDDSFYGVLGYYVGARCGDRIPVLTGLPPDTGEDRLKALGAAAASAGSVALFHAVGVTPEAPTLRDALHGRAPEEEFVVSLEELRATRDRLHTAPDGSPLDLVALGSPHFSYGEFQRLLPLLRGRRVSASVSMVVCTGRHVYERLAAEGSLAELERAGVHVMVDTCVVLTPLPVRPLRTMMTNSAKFAHYGPGRLGVDVIYASLEDCVRSAVAGKVVRDGSAWYG